MYEQTTKVLFAAPSAVGLGITLSHVHSYYLIKVVKVAKSCKCKHDATRRYLTLLDAIRRYSKLFDATRRYLTLLDAIRRYSKLLEATRRYSTLLDATRRYSTLLDATRRYSTLKIKKMLRHLGTRTLWSAVVAYSI
jgi:hypothetical protein